METLPSRQSARLLCTHAATTYARTNVFPLSDLTPEDEERLTLAVAQINRAVVNARQNDTLEKLSQFTDEQLAAPVPMVTDEQVLGDVSDRLLG
jgi:predicted transcriptional regulator